MSRSYKKVPGWIDNDKPRIKKYYKKIANGIVRRSKDLANGGYYRKLYNPWNICDYKNLYFYHRDLMESLKIRNETLEELKIAFHRVYAK